MTERLFQKDADLKGFLFRITDNGGETADRYSVHFCDGDCLNMSADPEFALGVSMWGDFDPNRIDELVESGRDKDLKWLELPEHIRKHVLWRCNEGWEDFLNQPTPIGRDAVEDHEGGYKDGGAGIYADEQGQIWIRRGEDGDLGPYETRREALLASLPSDYDLSGPEFHSPVEMWEGVE